MSYRSWSAQREQRRSAICSWIYTKKMNSFWISQCRYWHSLTRTKSQYRNGRKRNTIRFFEKIRQGEKARFVITAHHLNDSIETFILNLVKGSRLRGFTGIQERQGTLLRPFIHTSKNDIVEYAKKEWIPYREDISNSDTKYQRNRVRNNILPEFEAINPEYVNTLEILSSISSDSMKWWRAS